MNLMKHDPAADVAPLLLTVDQAAKSLQISVRHLYDLTKAGKIKVVRIGPRAVRYTLAALHEYIATTEAKD